jgi:hypothetical protein
MQAHVAALRRVYTEASPDLTSFLLLRISPSLKGLAHENRILKLGQKLIVLGLNKNLFTGFLHLSKIKPR